MSETTRIETTATGCEPRTPEGTSDTPGRKRAIRGFGYVYQRGRVWWVRYSHRGRDHRESSGCERETDAWRLLKERWKQIGRGRFVFGEDRVTMADLFAALELDYQNNRRRSIRGLRWRLAPLKAAFGEDRAIDVTEARVERYKAERLATKTSKRHGRAGRSLRRRSIASWRRSRARSASPSSRSA